MKWSAIDESLRNTAVGFRIQHRLVTCGPLFYADRLMIWELTSTKKANFSSLQKIIML
jgi:hypothetical protein